MPRRPTASSKDLVLLGLLAEEPLHAYGLEEKIRGRRMHEWTDISVSSVYRVLSALERRGWIDARLAHEGPGATRRVHSLTAEGRLALEEAVFDHLSALRPLKNPFALGLAFSVHAPLDEVAGRLRCRQEALGGLLQMIDEIEQQHEGPPRVTVDGVDPRLGMRLLFDLARWHLRAERDYLRHAAGLLEQARQAGVPDGTGEEGE